MAKLTPFLLFAAAVAQARTPLLTLGSPSPTAQTYSLVATLSDPGASGPLSGLEFSIHYSTAEFSSLSVSVTGQALAAGKQVQCSGVNGSATCILIGLNLNQIAAGTVARCSFVKSSGFRGSSSIQLTSALGVSPDGTGIAVSTVTKAGLGSLAGSVGGTPVSNNLTNEGVADWVHWSDSVRKLSGAPKISELQTLGPTSKVFYSDDIRSLSWADGGTVQFNPGSKDGYSVGGPGGGFQFTVPADSSARTLIVHVSGFSTSGNLTAQLSDGSAADFSDYTIYSKGWYDRDYVLRYHAASAGQTLKVTWARASGPGTVGISAAALF